jgi:hypothetical protein
MVCYPKLYGLVLRAVIFMTVIMLAGKERGGKTTTLNIVYNMLLSQNWNVTVKKQLGIEEEDFFAMLEKDGKTIVFNTIGDFPDIPIRAMEGTVYDAYTGIREKRYNVEDTAILIIACRANRGEFRDVFDKIKSYSHCIIEKTVTHMDRQRAHDILNNADAQKVLDAAFELEQVEKMGARLLSDFASLSKKAGFGGCSLCTEESGFVTLILQGKDIFARLYNCAVDVKVTGTGYYVSIYERDNRINRRFWTVVSSLFSHFLDNYAVSDRARYITAIPLSDYETVKALLQSILQAFDKIHHDYRPHPYVPGQERHHSL